MYKKILVPLDGSELAECVLPHVEAFIEGFNPSDLILLRVVEPENPYHGEYAIDTAMIEKRQSETMSIAKEYLDQIVNRLKNEGAAIHPEVIVGRVTEMLADYLEEQDLNTDDIVSLLSEEEIANADFGINNDTFSEESLEDYLIDNIDFEDIIEQ